MKGIEKVREHTAIEPARGLHYMRDVTSRAGWYRSQDAEALVHIFEPHTSCIGMLCQVVVTPVGHALNLTPAPRELIINVYTSPSVVRELGFGMVASAELGG